MNELMIYKTPLYDLVASYNEYFQIIERIKRNLNNPARLDEVLIELERAKDAGMKSLELETLRKNVDETMGWYNEFGVFKIEDET